MTSTWRDGGHLPPHYSKTKLTPAQRDDIRKRYADGETAIALAAEYGVSYQTIQRNIDARQPGSHQYPGRW